RVRPRLLGCRMRDCHRVVGEPSQPSSVSTSQRAISGSRVMSRTPVTTTTPGYRGEASGFDGLERVQDLGWKLIEVVRHVDSPLPPAGRSKSLRRSFVGDEFGYGTPCLGDDDLVSGLHL